MLLGLGLFMVMGISVYLKLWTMDYRFSADDTQLIRFFLIDILILLYL